MRIIIKPGDPTPPTIGGKARSLMQLAALGIPTAPFVVIPDTWFEVTFGKQLLDNQGAPQFGDLKLPDELLAEIRSSFDENTRFYAVRSSYRDEDSDQFSFAGQFRTRLFVPLTELAAAIADVWSSVASAHVVTYQREHGLKPQHFLSVIVQEMLDPKVSGVAFSLNPLTGHRKQKVINAVYGLGEGLVSGDLSADQFVVTDGQVEAQIASKTHAFIFDETTGNGLKKQEIAPAKQNLPCLADAQVLEVCQRVDQLKNHFGKHQDVEFAYCASKLYILQSRPVTTLRHLPDTHGQYIVWDNSNIIESYPGLTSPLTFTYIIQLYERAYRQFVALMGVPNQEIEANAEHFANMLGLLNGRVYYNLRSWYKMISMLPGYSFNARFMEQMMGVKERFDIEEADRRSKFRDFLRIANMVVSILRNLFTLEAQKRDFMQQFDAMQASIHTIDPESVSADQIVRLYKKQETLLLKIWKAPLVNDFFAMIYFGLLKKKMVGLFGEGTNIHNDLLIGENTIVTTKPAELITNMVNAIYASEELVALFKHPDKRHILSQINTQQEFLALRQDMEAYIAQFGDRTVGELKLETKTYKQYPELFIDVLQSYILNDRKPHSFDFRTGPSARMAAEEQIWGKMSGKPIARMVLKHIIKRTRQLVSGRENLRLYRTKAFGDARAAFFKIGQIFYSEGLLNEPEDVFMFTKDELFTYIQGTSVNYDLKALAAQRKMQYADFEKQPMQSERIKTYGIVYQGNSFLQGKSISEQPDGLRGIGCCKGVVSGKVKIVSKPEDAFDMDGDILVTTTTDPGWVTIFPSISGILVERGSLLSHAAIVSREMGIPCIVGIPGLTAKLKPGDFIEMDGEKGIVNILNNHSD
jgi:rifampicin phosphotransferase